MNNSDKLMASVILKTAAQDWYAPDNLKRTALGTALGGFFGGGAALSAGMMSRGLKRLPGKYKSLEVLRALIAGGVVGGGFLGGAQGAQSIWPPAKN